MNFNITRGEPWDGSIDWVRCCCPQCGLENHPLENTIPAHGDVIPYMCKRPDCRNIFLVSYKNEPVIDEIMQPGQAVIDHINKEILK